MRSIGPYQVLGHVGTGGMGEVYLAEDTRLRRKVALKSLRETTSSDPAARARLMREARAIAALNHPHIAAIYDVIDDADGRSNIVMEYVPGETLAERLQRGPMPVAQALEIAIDIAEALAAAHAQGVVHRDLKPANIRLTPDGRVKVLDFGLARTTPTESLETLAAAHRSPETIAGQIAGTPGYMSPEQLRARRVDGRTDIYSLGVMLFEMIAGHRPFAGDLLTAALAVLTQPSPRLRDAAPHVPPVLDAMVARMMAVDPDQRPGTAADLHQELERIQGELTVGAFKPVTTRRRARTRAVGYAVAAVLIVGVALAGVVRWRAARHPAVPLREVVAVLPLENLSGDPARAYLGAGIADTVGVALSKMPSVSVVSREEVQDALAQSHDPRKIVAATGASLLIDGSVQQAGDRMRITLRGVGPDGRVRWSDGYEDAADAVFNMQRTIASAVVRQLEAGAESPTPVTLPITSNVDALTAYWQGVSLAERAVSRRDFNDAITQFQRAIDLDPKFALAHAGLADLLWKQYTTFHDDALPRQALEAGLNALRLDPNQPPVMVAVATIYTGLGQYDTAMDMLQRALRNQPNNDDAHRALAQVFLNRGQTADALREFQAAIDVRPTRWTNYADLGRAYDKLRRPADAAAAFQRAIELRPGDPRLYTNLGVEYGRMGDNERAVQNFEKSNALVPTRLGFQNIGTVYYRLGRFTEAVAAYKSALAIDANSPVAHGNLGDAYLRLDRNGDAAHEFEAARALGVKAVEVNPKNAPGLAQLAVFEAKLEQHGNAARHMADALNLAPKDPDIRYKSAVVAALAGRLDAGLHELKLAIQLGSSAKDARDDYDLRALRSLPEFSSITTTP